jgi:hypothetical protein
MDLSRRSGSSASLFFTATMIAESIPGACQTVIAEPGASDGHA